jgi:asparagine synthase (glutamine-hydrolysing)
MGIVGVASLGSLEIATTVRRMGQSLVHRGPDEWGEFVEHAVGLGHTRLSILDLEHGQQPMISEHRDVVLVFNGEIYNFKDLWRDLESKGHRFRTDHSDTEVILNGYLQWGLDVFSRLNGMFAVAIWDRRTKTLVLARDRTGIKPLYYAELPGRGIIFASEPKAILRSGLFVPSFDPEALPEYFLHRAVIAPRTLWRFLAKLPAAHIFSHSDSGTSSLTQYWTPRTGTRTTIQMPEAAEVIEAELAQAIKSHLIADVPVGIFLSGGVDSSLVAALTSSLASPHAFTIGTKSTLDEVPFAAVVARHFGLELHSYYVEADEYLRALDDWVYFNDDPVSDPSALALFLLSRYARRAGMKVMLSGEGSDELFCGYTSYVRYAVLNLVKQIPLASRALKGFGRHLDDRTRDYLEQPGELTFLGTGHLTTRSLRKQMFVGVASDAPTPMRLSQDESMTPLRAALIFDQLIRLPNDILSRTDRATMAAGIEARVPFLDRGVIDAANSLGDACCLHPLSFQTKRVLKSILSKYLPSHLVYRKKLGFDLPIAKWLRTEFRHTAAEFLGERLVPGLNYDYWSSLYSLHCTGKRDHAGVLWAWLVLEQWYRRWVADHTPSTASMLEAAEKRSESEQSRLQVYDSPLA